MENYFVRPNFLKTRYILDTFKNSDMYSLYQANLTSLNRKTLHLCLILLQLKPSLIKIPLLALNDDVSHRRNVISERACACSRDHTSISFGPGVGDNESVSGFSLTRIRFRGSVKGAGHGAKNLSCTFSPWSFPFHGRFRCSDTKREEGSPFT